MQARRLIAISTDTKNSYVRVGIPADKIDVIHNAIDTSRFIPSSRSTQHHDKRVVYIGRISPEKGLRVLIDAVNAVLAHNPDVSLHIYGDDRAGTDRGRHFEELRRCAGERIDREITFHGHVLDTVPVIQSADLVVLPSTWDEPFGRIVIEAMSCGIPVVGSRVGGIPEILEADFPQLLVAPGDSAALATKIREFIGWREANPDFGEQCRNLVIAKFDKVRLMDSLMSLLLNVANGSTDPGTRSTEEL
jgi:glycosyltransferase involved in cell wall biosynthesis